MQRIEALIDRGPVEVNWLIGEVYGLVPPGRAWRAREWLRGYAAHRKGLEIQPQKPTEDAIRTGQRAVVREAIGKLVYAKRAHYLVQDDVKYLEKANPPRVNRSEVNRQWWENLSGEERAAWGDMMSNMHQRRTPKDRSETARRGWMTRRANH